MDHTLLPMLAVQGKKGAIYGEDWIAEGKLDGWRMIVHKTADGKIRIWGGRNGNEYTGQVPYLEAILENIIPLDTVVDGELISPMGHGAVQSSMTTLGAHIPSVALPALRLIMFDVLRLEGNDIRSLPWHQRRRVVDHIGNGADKLVSVSMVLPNDIALEVALNAGLEGVVFKAKSSSYINAKSSMWQKIKPQETLDAKVVGFKPGEGSFAGLVGALEFEILGSDVQSRCSGFDMAVRREITAHQEEWLGKIIEVKHHGLSKDGKPRHPQFLRVREDRVAGGDYPISDDPSGVSTLTPESIRDVDAGAYKISAPSGEGGTADRIAMRAPRVAPTKGAGGFSGRNYGQMLAPKLRQCIAELEAESGNAYDRCMAKNADPAVDLEVARNALEGRS